MTRHLDNEDGARWILAVSDLHRNRKQMDWVSEQSFDLLLLGGDLLDLGEGRNEVSDWIRSIDRPLAIASGNHDVMKEGPDWLYDLRGSGRIIDEVGYLHGYPICALPWQYDGGDWVDNSAHRCHQAARMRKPWVLLAHHIPPDAYQGEEDRKRALYFESQLAPVVAVTGHLHDLPSVSGGWINPGQNIFREPNHVWFDMKRRKGILNAFHPLHRDVNAFDF